MRSWRAIWAGWGLVSLLSYAAAVIFSPLAYPGYDWMAQAVSDLSADTAPSRVLWNRLSALYMPCGIVCVTLCCITVKGHFNRALREGVYLFALMNWISAVGYAMFPLTQAGISGQLQDVMHLAVTAAVVLLSIVSLTLIAFGGLRQQSCPALGGWALAALGLMIAGAVGTAVAARAYFGIPERFSVFACIIGVTVAGVCLVMEKQIENMAQQLDAVPVAAPEQVADGTYEGTAETPLVKVTVEVSVQDHVIRDIRLLRHENGRGTPAETMLSEMLRRNTSEVDTVSGATLSSKVIRAAVRDALAKGIAYYTVM